MCSFGIDSLCVRFLLIIAFTCQSEIKLCTHFYAHTIFNGGHLASPLSVYPVLTYILLYFPSHTVFLFCKNVLIFLMIMPMLFIELLALLVQQKEIKQHYKNRLVGYVLNGYLSLKKLLVQRTKLIDETQDKLLELLEDLTSGKYTVTSL